MALVQLNIQLAIDVLSTTDFGLHVEVASLEVIEEMMAESLLPRLAPYDSATMGTHT